MAVSQAGVDDYKCWISRSHIQVASQVQIREGYLERKEQQGAGVAGGTC